MQVRCLEFVHSSRLIIRAQCSNLTASGAEETSKTKEMENVVGRQDAGMTRRPQAFAYSISQHAIISRMTSPDRDNRVHEI